MLLESVGILTCFQPEAFDSHENISEDSVQCDWWKEAPNHCHCSDNVCFIIQLYTIACPGD